MTDYQKAKIYKIVDNTNQNVYIGSTCKTLKQRLSGHVSDYKRFIKGKYRNITSFEIINNGDYDIILIEAFPCDYKDELLARERYWVNKIKCINKNKPGIYNDLGKVEYDKHYHNEHKDQIKEYKKQYYAEKQDQIKEYRKQYYAEKQDQLNEKQKLYNKEHKAQIKQWQTTKCDCLCGGTYTLVNKSHHMKSEKHRKYIQTEALKKCLLDNLTFEETKQIYNKL